MANIRLSELPNLSAAGLTPGTDFLHIVDDSAVITGKNKKITVTALLSGAGGIEPIPYKHKEKFKVQKELQDKIENPTSDLFNLFAQLENALAEEPNEGNAFAVARLKAIKAGEDEFEVGGKKHKVTDVSDDDKKAAEEL